MKKLMIAMIVGVFTLSSFACDGNGGKGKKEKQEDERITTFVDQVR